MERSLVPRQMEHLDRSGTQDDGNDQDERLGKHEHYRRSRKAGLDRCGRLPGPVVPGASCAGRGEIEIVNRLSGFPVVDGIRHEPGSCFLNVERGKSCPLFQD
jgi:hypothetical protein